MTTLNSAFLVHFQTLCLRRAHKRFSFRNFSLGNGFLTGARDLFGSLPSAIFLFKSMAGVDQRVQVIPVINTNQTVIIAAQLANATTLIGQCNISHPTAPITQSLPSTPIRSHLRHGLRRDSQTWDTSLPPSGRPSLEEMRPELVSNGNLSYRKGEEEVPLTARIERVYYINLYGQVRYMLYYRLCSGSLPRAEPRVSGNCLPAQSPSLLLRLSVDQHCTLLGPTWLGNGYRNVSIPPSKSPFT